MKTQIKLLQGRALFISQDVHELRTKHTLLRLPFTCCIRLVDPSHNPLDGDIILLYQTDSYWEQAIKTKLPPSDFVFSEVPTRQRLYQPVGHADGYYEPEAVYLTYEQLKSYHYHVLQPTQTDLQRLLTKPYATYTFATGWWSVCFHLVAYHPCVEIAVWSRLWTHDYSGTLTIGLKEYQWPYPKEEWLSKSLYPISPTPSPPHSFLSFFPATGSSDGTHYHICHQIPDGDLVVWEGIMYYWRLPEPFNPP